MAPGASGSGPDAPRLGLKVPASFFSSVGLRFRPRCIAAKYFPCEEIANYARAKNRLAGPVSAAAFKYYDTPPRDGAGTSCLFAVGVCEIPARLEGSTLSLAVRPHQPIASHSASAVRGAKPPTFDSAPDRKFEAWSRLLIRRSQVRVLDKLHASHSGRYRQRPLRPLAPCNRHRRRCGRQRETRRQLKDLPDAVAILNTGCVNHDTKEEVERIDEDMAFAAHDLLA